MSRPTRSFKLRLSPAGMDLLIEAHCHLIRTTRKLIPWGTTLHVAVAHLEQVPEAALIHDLAIVRSAGLSGAEEHHVGAPNQLVHLAAGIASRVHSSVPDGNAPSLGHIYLLALYRLLRADDVALGRTYDSVKN